jgi:hypothetical protein
MRNEGNASESVTLLEEALDIGRRVLGKHKDTAATISEQRLLGVRWLSFAISSWHGGAAL